MLLRIFSSVSLIVSMFQRYADVVTPPRTTTTTTTQPQRQPQPQTHWPMLRVLLQPSLLGRFTLIAQTHYPVNLHSINTPYPINAL